METVINFIIQASNISSAVNKHFNDYKKTAVWMNSFNTELNGTPMDLILAGKANSMEILISEW